MPRVDYNQIAEVGGQMESGFLKLPEGTTVIRMLSDVYEMWFHRVSVKGRWKNIPVEKDVKFNGKDPDRQYVAIVLDRADNKVKIFQKGVTIFSKIAVLAADEEYGNPKEYDLKINRKGLTMQDTEYNVVASPRKSSLTEAEMAAYDSFAEKFNIDDYTRPLSEDEIDQKLEGSGINWRIAQEESETTTKASSATESPKPATSDETNRVPPDTTSDVNLDDIPF